MGFEELKQRQARAWGSAPFEEIAATLRPMHEAVVDTVVRPMGALWLDVGCGTGELTRLAAATGAVVTGVDLAAPLVETAATRAEEQRLDITYRVADVEDLPFDDASFDVVTSSVAAIFAPDHAAVARELARVCAPGGQLVLASWSATGAGAALADVTTRYAPTPQAGVGDPRRWGEEAYVRAMLGSAYELRFTHLECPLEGDSPAAMVETMEKNLGTCAGLLASLPVDRAAALRADLAALFAEHTIEEGRVVMNRPYVLVSGRRRRH